MKILARVVIVVFVAMLSGLTANAESCCFGFNGVCDRSGSFVAHYPFFYFGPDMLCDYSSFSTTSALPQRKGKGVDFGTYVAAGQAPIGCSGCFGVTMAVGLSRSRYWLADGKYLDWVTDGSNRVLTLMPNGNNVERGFMRYWSLRVPVCLEFQSHGTNSIFFSIGPELEYRFADISKVHYYNGNKQKLTKDINLSPFGVNVLAQFGTEWFGLIFRYSMTEMFDNSLPVKTYPMMIGLSFGF